MVNKISEFSTETSSDSVVPSHPDASCNWKCVSDVCVWKVLVRVHGRWKNRSRYSSMTHCFKFKHFIFTQSRIYYSSNSSGFNRANASVTFFQNLVARGLWSGSIMVSHGTGVRMSSWLWLSPVKKAAKREQGPVWCRCKWGWRSHENTMQCLGILILPQGTWHRCLPTGFIL